MTADCASYAAGFWLWGWAGLWCGAFEASWRGRWLIWLWRDDTRWAQ